MLTSLTIWKDVDLTLILLLNSRAARSGMSSRKQAAGSIVRMLSSKDTIYSSISEPTAISIQRSPVKSNPPRHSGDFTPGPKVSSRQAAKMFSMYAEQAKDDLQSLFCSPHRIWRLVFTKRMSAESLINHHRRSRFWWCYRDLPSCV